MILIIYVSGEHKQMFGCIEVFFPLVFPCFSLTQQQVSPYIFILRSPDKQKELYHKFKWRFKHCQAYQLLKVECGGHVNKTMHRRV